MESQIVVNGVWWLVVGGQLQQATMGGIVANDQITAEFSMTNSLEQAHFIKDSKVNTATNEAARKWRVFPFLVFFQPLELRSPDFFFKTGYDPYLKINSRAYCKTQL